MATAPGAAHYHAAIGALIIPHGHPHFVKGEPSHEVKGNISEAKWIANQWKGTTHEEAKEKAEKAVRRARTTGCRPGSTPTRCTTAWRRTSPRT